MKVTPSLEWFLLCGFRKILPTEGEMFGVTTRGRHLSLQPFEAEEEQLFHLFIICQKPHRYNLEPSIWLTDESSSRWAAESLFRSLHALFNFSCSYVKTFSLFWRWVLWFLFFWVTFILKLLNFIYKYSPRHFYLFI